MDQTNILIKPIITEKSMDEAGRGRFTFAVLEKANKPQIKNTVEKQFNVNVISVKTLIVKGKKSRVGRKRIVRHASPFKKAIVELSQGQKIDLFEVQTETPPKAG